MPSAAQAMPYMCASEKPVKIAMAMMMQGTMAAGGAHRAHGSSKWKQVRGWTGAGKLRRSRQQQHSLLCITPQQQRAPSPLL